MIVSTIKEMRIAVMNIYEEDQIKVILDNLGIRYKMQLREEDGVKIFIVNLQNR